MAEYDVIIYTDGACTGNPGPGGWGTVLHHVASGKEKELSGGAPQTTNNQMELTAVIEGLKTLNRPCTVKVVSDSSYVVKGMNEWITGWIQKNWINSQRKPVKNKELWQELHHLAQIHQVTFEWIKGHAGHPQNERCDQLAVAAYQPYIT